MDSFEGKGESITTSKLSYARRALDAALGSAYFHVSASSGFRKLAKAIYSEQKVPPANSSPPAGSDSQAIVCCHGGLTSSMSMPPPITKPKNKNTNHAAISEPIGPQTSHKTHLSPRFICRPNVLAQPRPKGVGCNVWFGFLSSVWQTKICMRQQKLPILKIERLDNLQ